MSHTTTTPPPCPNPACQSEDTDQFDIPADRAGAAGCDTSFYECNECGAQWGLDLGEWRRKPEYGD